MAINPVSLAEVLRPWRGAGVTHFLAEVFDNAPEQGEEQPSTQDMSFSAPVEAQPAGILQAGVAAGDVTGAHSGAEARAPHASPQATGQRGDPSGNSPRHSADPEVSRAAPSSPAPAVQKNQAEAFADPSSWPEEWQAIFSRTSPAPLVWTYPELGADLSGRGSKERSACLRTLIGTLSLPRGSSAFWPVSLYPEREEATEPFLFQAGLQLLAPKVVVMLGAETVTLTGLNVPLHQPFTQHIYQGRLYVLVPGFEALLSRSGLPDKACAFLRSAFAGLPTLFHS